MLCVLMIITIATAGCDHGTGLLGRKRMDADGRRIEDIIAEVSAGTVRDRAYFLDHQ